MGMILAKNVSKIYETGSKKTYALSDVSFEIDKGELNKIAVRWPVKAVA